MARIRDTNDPIERRRLLAQHREMMVEQMQAMQHMGCSTGIRSGERMQCDQIDQDRMDMINDLLHQMLEHEKAER